MLSKIGRGLFPADIHKITIGVIKMPKKNVSSEKYSKRGVILCFVIGFIVGVCGAFALKHINMGGCHFHCTDGTCADDNGCCPGEVYTDMGDGMGWNCCPTSGGDCFPPMK